MNEKCALFSNQKRNLGEGYMRTVQFISQLEAERLKPVAGAAMISITDPDKKRAALEGWDNLYRVSFYDGDYSEDTIHIMKNEFRIRFSGYLDSSQAQELSQHIDSLVNNGIENFFIHCHYGESRSGAVALYLINKHNFSSERQPINYNRMVYMLLNHPLKYESLIRKYEEENNPNKEATEVQFYKLLTAAIKRNGIFIGCLQTLRGKDTF